MLEMMVLTIQGQVTVMNLTDVTQMVPVNTLIQIMQEIPITGQRKKHPEMQQFYLMLFQANSLVSILYKN